MYEVRLFVAIQPRLQLRDSEGRLLEVGGDIVPPAQLVQQELLPLSFSIFDTSVVDLRPDPHGSASLWVPGSESTSNKNPHPDQHQSDADPQHCLIVFTHGVLAFNP
jgi:hypothetical protein